MAFEVLSMKHSLMAGPAHSIGRAAIKAMGFSTLEVNPTIDRKRKSDFGFMIVPTNLALCARLS